MCLHETVQLTDEHRIIMCADCGREFGHMMRDEAETFVAYVARDQPVVAVACEGEAGYESARGLALELSTAGTGAGIGSIGVHPCRTCGWAGTCDPDDGGCHT